MKKWIKITLVMITISFMYISQSECREDSAQRLSANDFRTSESINDRPGTYMGNHYYIKAKTYKIEGIVIESSEYKLKIDPNIQLKEHWGGKYKDKIQSVHLFCYGKDDSTGKVDSISQWSKIIKGDKIILIGKTLSMSDYSRTQIENDIQELSIEIISFDNDLILANDNKRKKIKEVSDKTSAENQFKQAQLKMKLDEDDYQRKQKKIADLKSGSVKITNRDEAKLAFEPSNDTSFTVGVPIDGFDKNQLGKYYEWNGQLKTRIGNTYVCEVGNDRYFAFKNIVVRYNNMIENSGITVIGKLAGEYELTFTNQISGIKSSKRVAILSDCYIF